MGEGAVEEKLTLLWSLIVVIVTSLVLLLIFISAVVFTEAFMTSLLLCSCYMKKVCMYILTSLYSILHVRVCVWNATKTASTICSSVNAKLAKVIICKHNCILWCFSRFLLISKPTLKKYLVAAYSCGHKQFNYYYLFIFFVMVTFFFFCYLNSHKRACVCYIFTWINDFLNSIPLIFFSTSLLCACVASSSLTFVMGTTDFLFMCRIETQRCKQNWGLFRFESKHNANIN